MYDCHGDFLIGEQKYCIVCSIVWGIKVASCLSLFVVVHMFLYHSTSMYEGSLLA